jgi:2-polyprenyl-3-methyl-5-hydroxy-6-metoxy-1,4-benzoquinol methylase
LRTSYNREVAKDARRSVHPEEFIIEVYRRMSDGGDKQPETTLEELRNSPIVREAVQKYRGVLPQDRNAAILDIGFGNGWFIAACVELGYTNIYGAEFGGRKAYLETWPPAVRKIYAIESNIGDLLADKPQQFDFIHLSHVIEHIPKYTLLFNCDGLYLALKKGGTLLVRTPNMEGPCATSSLFVTLGHEQGFCGSNLRSLLQICNFEEIRFLRLDRFSRPLRQKLGSLIRWPIVRWSAFKHRFFGVNSGGQFGAELIVSARRRAKPALFDEKYR